MTTRLIRELSPEIPATSVNACFDDRKEVFETWVNEFQLLICLIQTGSKMNESSRTICTRRVAKYRLRGLGPFCDPKVVPSFSLLQPHYKRFAATKVRSQNGISLSLTHFKSTRLTRFSSLLGAKRIAKTLSHFNSYPNFLTKIRVRRVARLRVSG
jgi:hypothetical protein